LDDFYVIVYNSSRLSPPKGGPPGPLGGGHKEGLCAKYYSFFWELLSLLLWVWAYIIMSAPSLPKKIVKLTLGLRITISIPMAMLKIQFIPMENLATPTWLVTITSKKCIPINPGKNS